jgi:hypothetical protein
MQTGELIVVGENHIIIPLNAFPSKVSVKFKDHEPERAPCDPGDVDFVACEVHASNHHLSGFVLRIDWSVSSVREVIWHAYY